MSSNKVCIEFKKNNLYNSIHKKNDFIDDRRVNVDRKNVSSTRMLGAYLTRMEKVTSRVDKTEGKPAFDIEKTSEPLPFVSPESVGVDSGYIDDFYTELESKNSLRLQTLIIARGDKIISKGEFYPYTLNIKSAFHSLSKSVTSLAIGLLISEGKLTLDTKLGDIFASEIGVIGKLTGAKITIRHLLTMSTGVQFNEINSVTDKNWTAQFLSSIQKFRPGTSFQYNSMNSYMLASAIVKITGQSLCDYLSERLFSPLGITSYYWEKSPEGIEKGGWGLYMLPEDVLKLGTLILQNGMWKNKRIIPYKWIKEATKVQIKTPPITGKYDYGYHMWVDPEEDEVLFNGMFGRNLHIFKKNCMLVLTTGYNSDVFQRSDIYPLIKKYFGKKYIPKSVLDENEDALEMLRKHEKCLYNREHQHGRLLSGKCRSDGKALLGNCVKTVSLYDDERRGVSLLPTMCQAIHNNFRPGIKRIRYEFGENGCGIKITEDDCTYSFYAGYEKSVESVVKIGDDEYRISCYGELTLDEEDVPVLKLTVAFLELSNLRYIRTYFYSDGIRIKAQEFPGHKFAMQALKTVVDEATDSAVVKSAKKAVNSRLFKERVKYFLFPSVNGEEL